VSAFFARRASGFVATEHTRGPWSEAHQHGGPPAALLVRALEGLAGEARLARLDFELLRPVPIAELAVTAAVTRAGRKVTRLEATLSAEDRVVMRAAALAVRVPAVEVDAAPAAAPRPPAESAPWTFPFFRWPVGYHTAMELRVAAGRFGEGRMAAWMRMRLPLVEGEAPTGMQRLVVAADSGSGVSLLLDAARFTFLNPDLGLHVLRPPEGEWVCLDARTRVDPGGVGLAETEIFDERGFVGRGAQALVLEARG
jgi:hypothetical protein